MLDKVLLGDGARDPRGLHRGLGVERALDERLDPPVDDPAVRLVLVLEELEERPDRAEPPARGDVELGALERVRERAEGVRGRGAFRPERGAGRSGEGGGERLEVLAEQKLRCRVEREAGVQILRLAGRVRSGQRAEDGEGVSAMALEDLEVLDALTRKKRTRGGPVLRRERQLGVRCAGGGATDHLPHLRENNKRFRFSCGAGIGMRLSPRRPG